MKLGYSILLGETIEAQRLQYRDCERFQVVCPHCREPVFKVRRNADSTEEMHYLAHYAAGAAYQGECDLRVWRAVTNEIERQNAVSREQRLAYFLSVLRRTLSLSPVYSTTAEKTHWKLNNAPALTWVRDHAWETVFLPFKEELFDQGTEDYLWRLSEDGWALSTTFSLERQKQIARDMWLTVMTPVGRSNYNFLFNHAWIHVLSHTIARIDDYSGLDRAVSETIVHYMHELSIAKKSAVRPLIEQMMQTSLPAGYLKTRGQDTDDPPSTFFLRVMGQVEIEMVGTLIEMPYFELLKQQYGDPSKVYPYQPGSEPVDPEEIAKKKAWQERHQDRSAKH